MSISEYRLARSRSAQMVRRSSSASRIPLVRSSSVVSLGAYPYNRPTTRPLYHFPSAEFVSHREYRGSRLLDDYSHYEPLYYRTYYNPIPMYNSYRSPTRYYPSVFGWYPYSRPYLWRPRHSVYESRNIDPYYNWYSRSAYYSPYRPSLFDDVNRNLFGWVKKLSIHRRNVLWESVRWTPMPLP
ncbi:unnamed protein product [Bursaphelenchus xylophilus]|uniref:(pine wood nematode) hypothetical protein n=1 Tax=Bursaphelenchus xylophilus TaxID=6326 RepID=A0A1I7STA3_BURXY|nr:unnamed protein product [Bursaphelenchus xylophilus]CAG9108615.1 unnamed protein product [Bursaphelenchus xylophilus]